MSKIIPVGSRILIDLDESPETFADGQLILANLPDKDGDYRPKPAKGTVVACGNRVEELEVGDTVIVDKYHGVKVPPLTIGDSYLTRLMLVKEAFVMLKGK